MNYKKESLNLHSRHGGKLGVYSKVSLNKKNLKLAYTPGVAEVCKEIAKRPKDVFKYTLKKNSLAVVTDGSSVLGLGNIGAEAAIPVMEGKAVLFRELAGIDAFPICLNSQDPAEIVRIVRRIAPVFGAINLEDIHAPNCFFVEKELQDLGIPTMHDDQHCTAIVVMAGLINSCRVLGKKFSELKVVVNGAGAAGSGIARFLSCQDCDGCKCEGVGEIIVADSKGTIYFGREMEDYKKERFGFSNPRKVKGDLREALRGADVFIGVSKAGILKKEMIKAMAKDPIIFALANPVPEIFPQEALDAGAAIVATGRSDFPNQVNNVLAFPGVFRGALDSRAARISSAMKYAAAHALASSIKSPTRKKILPDVFDRRTAKIISNAVARAS
jgi:malate dehydrogenase (oxaloacetate-decarboxylating)